MVKVGLTYTPSDLLSLGFRIALVDQEYRTLYDSFEKMEDLSKDNVIEFMKTRMSQMKSQYEQLSGTGKVKKVKDPDAVPKKRTLYNIYMQAIGTALKPLNTSNKDLTNISCREVANTIFKLNGKFWREHFKNHFASTDYEHKIVKTILGKSAPVLEDGDKYKLCHLTHEQIKTVADKMNKDFAEDSEFYAYIKSTYKDTIAEFVPTSTNVNEPEKKTIVKAVVKKIVKKA